jgi:hypothetical protein
LVLSYAAEADGVGTDPLIEALLEKVRHPGQALESTGPSWFRRVWNALVLTPDERRRIA